MVTVERTQDYELIRQIMTHPRIYPSITDDFSPPAEAFQPVEHHGLLYLLMKDEEGPLGIGLLVPENGVEMRVHHYFLPRAWGSKAEEAARQALKYLWTHTGCMRVIGKTPAYNRLALRFACRLGMRYIGVDRDSVQKNGRLWAQYISGMSRPEEYRNGN